MCGPGSTPTSGTGRDPVSSVSAPRSIGTTLLLSVHLLHLMHVSIMSMSTWLAPCHPPMAVCISSHASTALRGGPRRSPLWMLQLTQWPGLSSRRGSPGLAFPPPSPLTVAGNLNPACGSHSQSYLVSNICARPVANGQVERLHRQLKAVLKASPQPDRWADMLPMALLGIRSSIKDDLHCTTAELVYGTGLRLPGEFFTSHDGDNTDPASYVVQLKHTMRALRYTPPQQPQQPRGQVDSSLGSASHVFVCHDAVKRPLQQPYDGPFRVLARSDKFYTLDLNGRRDTVSVDRLKPAHLDLLPVENKSASHPPTRPWSRLPHSRWTHANHPSHPLHPSHLPPALHDQDVVYTGQPTLLTSFTSGSLEG